MVLFVGVVASFILPYISNSITKSDGHIAQILFIILIAKTVFLLFNHAFSGWFIAYEYFTVNKLLAVGNIILRLILVCILLPLVPSALTVVLIDAGLTFLQLILNYIYSRKKISVKISIKKWNKNLAKEVIFFTSSLFLMSIINQFNSNVDNIVLGFFSTTSIVGLYSCAMQIYTMYSSLSTAIQEAYLPSISQKVFSGSTNKEITQSLVEPSRMQVCILFLALSGFLLFGREFFELWIGESYSKSEIDSCYLICLLIMASATLQLFQNTTTCVLKAKNMMRGRVIIIGISTLLNFVLTLILVPIYGMYGAAIGTAISMIFGYGIATNVYYKIRVGIDTKMYFKNTLKGIWIAVLISLLIGFLIIEIPTSSLLLSILKVLFYIFIYCLIMYLFGLSKDEKNFLKNRLKNIFRK